MKRFSNTILFGLFVLFVTGIPMAAAEVPRAALQDFAPASDSYWSGRQAAAFTAAVQAHLFSDEEVEWVERSDLDAAAGELALSRWEGGDEVSMLRIGKWLRADFMVNGAFASGEEETTLLNLEIVEVDRADVVASATLRLESDNGSHPLAEKSEGVKKSEGVRLSISILTCY